MKGITLFAIVSLLFSATIFAQDEFEVQEGDTTFIMKKYYLCLLKRGDRVLEISEDQLAALQNGHLAHINQMAEDGKVMIAGPFGDDGDLRGILIMSVSGQAEADSLVSQDPAVKAGRLSFEIHPWWGAKGSTLN